MYTLLNLHIQVKLEDLAAQLESLKKELEKSQKEQKLSQMRLDEVEKENSELSAECDILAGQVNEEKAKVMIYRNRKYQGWHIGLPIYRLSQYIGVF